MDERIRIYGTNAPKIIPTKSLCRLILEQLGDPILRILVIAALIALVLGISKEGLDTVILCINFKGLDRWISYNNSSDYYSYSSISEQLWERTSVSQADGIERR